MFKAYVLVVSDRSKDGEREDISGKLLVSLLEKNGFLVSGYDIVRDEKIEIEETLKKISDITDTSLILTTGGTGFAPRDVTPEATLSVADKFVPGIAEEIRRMSLLKTPFAVLSRATSVIRGNTLIINLPGSPNAVEEAFDVFIKIIPHGLSLLNGEKVDG